MTATLFAVVVISAQVDGARGIAGSAQAGPVPPPPSIGQCLLEPTGRFGGWGFGEPLHPALRLARCTGDRWGEVVSILPAAPATPPSVSTTDGSGALALAVENPNHSRCDRDRLTYLGLPAGPSTQRGWGLLVGTVAAVGPTSLQRAAGQSWVACIITPINGAPSPRYHGSTRNTLNTGVLPVAFATCTTTVSAAGFLPSPCDRPHHVEIFGVATTLPGDTPPGLDATCLKLVKWLMRTPDPTKQGLLLVRAFTTHTDQSGTAVLGLGPDGDASCIVEPTNDHQLQGTLFGLGPHPIPWA